MSKIHSKTLKVYIAVGTYSLAWAIAAYIKALLPDIYNSLAEGGGIIWICCCILGPLVAIWITDEVFGKWAKVDMAYISLLGCAEGVMSMEWVFGYISKNRMVYATGTLLWGICGLSAGYQLTYSRRLHEKHRLEPIHNLVASVIYGIMTGGLISSIIPYKASTADMYAARICFVAATIIASAIAMVLLSCLDRWDASAANIIMPELNRVIEKLNTYEKNLRKSKADRAAKEAKAREARERAKKAEESRWTYKEAAGAGKGQEEAHRGRQGRERTDGARGQREERERNEKERTRRREQETSGKLRYFAGCRNMTELKRRYRQLCKKLHPDCGGSVDAFRTMQKEYEQVCSRMAG